MAIVHAVLFAFAVSAVVFAASRWRTEPVLALILGAAAFGAACGVSLGQLGKSFGGGFGAAAAGPGLAVIAAALIGGMAQGCGATQALADASVRRRRFVAVATPLAGLAGGIGGAPASAFALLRPLGAAVAAEPIRLALAMAAGQGLLLPSPVMVAATAILAADWRLVLAIGAACALAIVLAVAALGPVSAARRWNAGAPAPPSRPDRVAAVALVAVSVAMVALLVVQSLGNLPSEPFGGGSARALLLGLGRPFILMLVGLAGMAPFCLRRGMNDVVKAAILHAAPMVLLLGAAGGLQSIVMDSRIADGVSEAISGWHVGLLAPFLVAASLKSLLGASPVAAISAAGLLQPALAGLGLDDPVGRACAALAVGAGAMSGVHVNDGFFWLVTDAAGMRPSRGMAWLFGGTWLLGSIAMALLWLVHAAWLAL
jgi:GntP family gluconate:H+ symporter